jgi:hypothetical protein
MHFTAAFAGGEDVRLPLPATCRLCLNKPLGGSVHELRDKINELREKNQGDSTTWSGLLGSLVGMVTAAPMQVGGRDTLGPCKCHCGAGKCGG